MSARAIASGVAFLFQEWTEATSTEMIEKLINSSPECLADYIEAWVIDGSAVHDCHGSYETYLVGVIGIIDRWMNYPGLIDHLEVQRRVTRVFREDDRERAVLGRHFFEGWTFRTLHGDER